MPSKQRLKSGAAAPTETCNAKTRRGTLCRQKAGARTDHVGAGRCFLHGGKSLVKHGRYSTIKRESLKTLIEQHEADPDPLNILPELAAARALFQDFVERYDEWADALTAWHASFSDAYRAEIELRCAAHDAATCPFLGPDPRERFDGKPVQILDVADAYRIVSEITKIVERIEKVRAANAISRADLLRVMQEMGRVVQRFVTDGPTLEQIKDGFLAIRVA